MNTEFYVKFHTKTPGKPQANLHDKIAPSTSGVEAFVFALDYVRNLPESRCCNRRVGLPAHRVRLEKAPKESLTPLKLSTN